MLKSKKRWKIEQKDHSLKEQFSNKLGVSSLVAGLLLNRGISSVEQADQFLHSEKCHFHDPFLMKGMGLAVERIEKAVESQEKILVFGDYDADGVSSTAVLLLALKKIMANVDYYIPNRFTEGYGPNETALRKAKEQGYSLIVTVDTGISAVYEAQIAQELEIDFIITDHHEPPPQLPEAYAIVNPKQVDCPYPFKSLAGVGVAFKLAQALLGRLPEELFDLAVIGTVADLVPLIDENRLIVKKGLAALANTARPGLQALKKKASITDKQLTADHVGFGIGPRINAAGRLASASPAVQLMVTEDRLVADELALEIDELNKARQEIVAQITAEAIEIVEQNYVSITEHKVLLVAKEGWNAGVIGIVASRLVERYYRPTIVLAIDQEKGIAKGSARSIEGFDIFKSLSESRDILPHFGGHPMAAGLTMKLADVSVLRQRLNQLASQCLTDNDYIPALKIDLEISVADISIQAIEEMGLLAPFGVANPPPKLKISEVSLKQIRRIGSEENHLKLLLEENGTTIDCVGFHFGHLYDEITMAAQISVVGNLSVNEWNGHCKPQLMLEDVAINDWQVFDCRGAKSFEKYTQLPKEKIICLYFDERTVTALKLDTSGCQLVNPPSVPESEGLNFSGKFVFLLDMPFEKGELEALLRRAGKPERLYPIFYQHEAHFFATLPSRDHFKWFYGFLTKQSPFDVKNHGAQLAKHKGWSPETIDFMVKVFFELEFVTIKNGLISLATAIEKKDLSCSRTYRRKQEQAKLENDLYYSSYSELRGWLEEIYSNQLVK